MWLVAQIYLGWGCLCGTRIMTAMLTERGGFEPCQTFGSHVGSVLVSSTQTCEFSQVIYSLGSHSFVLSHGRMIFTFYASCNERHQVGSLTNPFP